MTLSTSRRIPAQRPAVSLLPQTNIQFYAWIKELGYNDHDLSYLKSIYELSQEVFGGMFRASGKPFTSHLIGTASAVSLEQPPVWVVGTALCHLPMRTGDFHGLKSMNQRQEILSSRLHRGELELDAIYEAIRKKKNLQLDQLGNADWKPALLEQYALLIWAANELEDELDAGTFFAPGKHQPGDSSVRVFKLTRAFKWDSLELLAADIYRQHNGMDWAQPLSSDRRSAYGLADLTGRFPTRTRIQWKLRHLARMLSPG